MALIRLIFPESSGRQSPTLSSWEMSCEKSGSHGRWLQYTIALRLSDQSLAKTSVNKIVLLFS